MKYLIVATIFFALGFFVKAIQQDSSGLPKEITVKQGSCPKEAKSPIRTKIIEIEKILTKSGCKLSEVKKKELNTVLKESHKSNHEADVPNGIEKVDLPEGSLSFRDNVELNIAEASEIAKLFELKEPELYFRSANLIKKFDKRIEKLNGRYYGKLYMKPYDRAPDDISLDINFSKTDSGKIEGQLELILSRNGKEYSIKRRKTGNKDVRVDEKNSDSILIESSPRGFFHLNLKNTNVLNYYYRGLHVGIAQLFKE